MSRKRAIVVTFFLLFLLPATLFLRCQREQKLREIVEAATLSRLSRDIRPGSSRVEVESYFRRQHFDFFQRSGNNKTYDDLIPLGRQPSGTFVCGPIQFGVAVAFQPATIRSASEDMAEDADKVSAIKAYQSADNCL